MSAQPSRHSNTTLFVSLGLVLLSYLGAMALFWLSLGSSESVTTYGGISPHILMAGLVTLGFAGIGTAAFLLHRALAGEHLRDLLAMQNINEQVIETGKMASIGEMAAGIAHEINNPVAIMVEEAGWMEDLLQEDKELAKSSNFEELLRALAQIRNQGSRCRDITHKMLSFARKSNLRVEDVHLNSLIEEVSALSEKRALYANCRIELNLDQNLPAIPASTSEMQQVCLNLINNALDAMEEKGGILTITSTSSQINNIAEVHFADTGVGIPKANLSRIFDPFFTTKAVGKGTGLGLSICYTIINNMGGEIKVISQVDAGSLFVVRLPLTNVEQKQNLS
ncbi:sensor histidine kinase [Desulfonatronum thiosulfatophilum]|nr:ATP-binding protein [Desulfonatronum thiosulfatophilum]